MSNFIITILQDSMIYLVYFTNKRYYTELENILPVSTCAQQCTAPSKDQKTGLSV